MSKNLEESLWTRDMGGNQSWMLMISRPWGGTVLKIGRILSWKLLQRLMNTVHHTIHNCMLKCYIAKKKQLDPETLLSSLSQSLFKMNLSKVENCYVVEQIEIWNSFLENMDTMFFVIRRRGAIQLFITAQFKNLYL